MQDALASEEDAGAPEDAHSRRVVAGQGPLDVATAATHPCLCLCRAFFEQMTMVLPWRLITRQLSHIGLTEALTFIGGDR
jgi:hypothetical protein